MSRPTPVRNAATWIAATVAAVVAVAALTACSLAPGVDESDPDAPTGPTPRIRAGLGIDGVAYVGDPKDVLPGGIDDVEVDSAAGSVTYVYDDEAGDPSREVVICTATDRVRAARLWNTPENQAHATLQGIGLSSRQSEVESALGVPFGDGFDSATGRYVLQYQGPFADTWIVFAYAEADRSRMVRIEVFGPGCP